MEAVQEGGLNDVVIKLATVNGTGSASANSLLMRAIFRMGVPVMGRNYFPSNIQGLPTWYEIRVTGDGYHSRSNRVDVMVAMNAQTYQKDLAEVGSGGFLIYDSTYTDEEFPRYVSWGHSTWQEGVRLCREAGAKQLAIFHHNPDHTDDVMEQIEKRAAELNSMLRMCFETCRQIDALAGLRDRDDLNLIFILVIVLITRYVNRVLQEIADDIEERKLVLKGFPVDWALRRQDS